MSKPTDAKGNASAFKRITGNYAVRFYAVAFVVLALVWWFL